MARCSQLGTVGQVHRLGGLYRSCIMPFPNTAVPERHSERVRGTIGVLVVPGSMLELVSLGCSLHAVLSVLLPFGHPLLLFGRL